MIWTELQWAGQDSFHLLSPPLLGTEWEAQASMVGPFGNELLQCQSDAPGKVGNYRQDSWEWGLGEVSMDSAALGLSWSSGRGPERGEWAVAGGWGRRLGASFLYPSMSS